MELAGLKLEREQENTSRVAVDVMSGPLMLEARVRGVGGLKTARRRRTRRERAIDSEVETGVLCLSCLDVGSPSAEDYSCWNT